MTASARRASCAAVARFYSVGVLLGGVVSNSTEQAVGLFPTREEAEAIVRAWDRDEPDHAGMLNLELVELESSPN
jgi:hypothetical protein